MAANRTLFGIFQKARVQIILFAVVLVVYVVERLAAQRSTARHANEAARVVQVAHGQAGLVSVVDLF